MTNKTFHADELSYTLKCPKVMPLVYSDHALDACQNDRYGVIPQFSHSPSEAYVFAIETKYSLDTKSHNIVKYNLRFNFNDDLDIILVLAVRDGHYAVVTTWINTKEDNHATLDLNRYQNARKNKVAYSK